MKKFEISESVLESVFNYLVTCPFSQVEQLVQGLRETAQKEILEEKNITKKTTK